MSIAIIPGDGIQIAEIFTYDAYMPIASPMIANTSFIITMNAP